MAETAAAEAARRAWAPESRAVIADVRNHPRLVVSGASDGDIMLWRRGSGAAEPQAIAALTLDRDGSQLFAGEKFVGRLFEAEGEALFLPDWLRDIGASSAHSEDSIDHGTVASVDQSSGTSGGLPKPEELPGAPRSASVIPVEWTTDFAYACKALGLDRRRASKILHELKEDNFLGGADNVLIHIPSGDVYYGDECIGNLRD